MEYTSKEQLIEQLKKQIASSDHQALKALQKVYLNQTYEEQAERATKEFNGIGFSGRDAEILSSFAEQYEKRGTLSLKQMAILKRIMPRYARQLVHQSISEGKIRKENGRYVW